MRYIVGFVCVVFAILVFARHVAVVRFLAASSTEAIHAGVFVNGVAVGGLLRTEAEEVLTAAAGLDRQMIGFVYNDSLVFSWSFADFGARFDFGALIDEAYRFGREGARRERYNQLRSGEPHFIHSEPQYSYDEAKIPERLEAVRAQASVYASNASMKLEGGQFTVTEGIPGRTPDMQAAGEQLRQILAARPPAASHIVLEMKEIPPAYTASHFENARSLLGYFSTPYPGGDEIPRSINIRLAASLINNTIVLPGETFSTRAIVGKGVAEEGYVKASVILDGRLVEDYGGGLCQVASTLYNAVLYAELPVVERANHSLKVFYMEAGFDAAIAGDYMDLKFKNNTEYPVLVTAAAQNAVLGVRIYGHETRPPGRTLAFVSELLEVIPPEPDKVLQDDSLPSGHVLISTEPQDGYKYELFRIVFMDGEQVARERVNTSIYRPVQGVIRIGE